MDYARKKQHSPTERIILSDKFQSDLIRVNSCQKSVDAYNAFVDRTNELINKQKSAAQEGTGINELRKQLVHLEAKKKRFEPRVKEACRKYQEAIDLKSIRTEEKDNLKTQLNQHCKKILEAYQASINKYLDQFNAGFKITSSQHSYRGGTPSSNYKIEINNIPIELGDSRTQRGTPCFKTALSSGDRSALAFAFFLASLDQDAEIANKIIVFDDPFTSQDRFRRTCTQQLIRHFAEKAKQVIVLSHDPHFLKLIWEGYFSGDIKTLQLCLTGDNTVILVWDIEEETQSTYMKNYATLLDFYRERNGIALYVAQAIRPFLEGMLRAHFPGHFHPNEWLGDFTRKIRDADNSDGLSHAKADLSEIEAIKDYSKKYHHDQNSNADNEPISEDELHGFVKRTLRLVGGC